MLEDNLIFTYYLQSFFLKPPVLLVQASKAEEEVQLRVLHKAKHKTMDSLTLITLDVPLSPRVHPHTGSRLQNFLPASPILGTYGPPLARNLFLFHVKF